LTFFVNLSMTIDKLPYTVKGVIYIFINILLRMSFIVASLALVLMIIVFIAAKGMFIT
jgi:hypothetical protein